MPYLCLCVYGATFCSCLILENKRKLVEMSLANLNTANLRYYFCVYFASFITRHAVSMQTFWLNHGFILGSPAVQKSPTKGVSHQSEAALAHLGGVVNNPVSLPLYPVYFISLLYVINK